MDFKQTSMICVTIIIVAIIIAIALINPFSAAQETNIEVLSNSSLNENDYFEVELTNESKSPIENQTVSIAIKDGGDTLKAENAVTDSNGNAEIDLKGIEPGNYTVEVIYDGNDEYKPSNITTHVEIKKEAVAAKDNGVKVVGEHVEFNGQAGEGYFREVEYSDGNFRQYDLYTGELIGSTYQSDQKYFEPII